MKKALVFHPILFVIFPVLFLFARNMDLFHVGTILGPIVATACLALLAWVALSLVLKDTSKAGLIVSLFLLLFFSYDIFLGAIEDFVRGLGVSRAWTREYLWLCLLLVWAILFTLGTCLLAKARRNLRNLTNVANVIASALVVMSLINIGAYEVHTRSPWREALSTERKEANPADLEEAGMLPNIYYIILDGYGRADVLEEIYQHDNTDFLEYLTGKGFFVADRSRANYMQTTLSLASSLNLTYLDDSANRLDIESSDKTPLVRMIWDSRVVRLLKNHGYTIVAFSSGWFGTELRGADIYLAPRWHPDEFQSRLIGMTPVPVLVNQLGGPDSYALHRERILYTFEGLADVAELEGPIFVFAHIIAPHPPFVFGRHGEAIDPEYRFTMKDGGQIINRGRLSRDEYVHNYREQLIFTNSRIQEAVDGILSESTRPAIVILQGDHGPGSMLDWESADNTYLKERFSILNAYYLPNGGHTDLYDEITPVNTFRVILNHCLGTDYELLEDESHFSTYGRPYAFMDVTDELDNDDVGMKDVE